MVSFLESAIRTRHARECVTELYPRVHQVLRDNFDEDGEFVERLVGVLIAYKFENFEKDVPHVHCIMPNGASNESSTVVRFQKTIKQEVPRGGKFAVKLVNALENALEQSLRNPAWPLGLQDGWR